jgi:hypothetical protein
MLPRVVLCVAVPLVLLFAVVSGATAGPPAQSVQQADFTFQSTFWSGTCGVPVFIHQVGTLRFTFVPDSNVIHEVDTFPRWTVTIYSPVDEGGTGKSFTFLQPYPIHFVYPEGTDLGDPGFATATGALDMAAPGGPVIAGKQVLTGPIVDYTPEGVPIVDLNEEVSTTGHFPEDFTEARCAFLTDP